MHNDYIIVSDSTTDLPQSMADEMGLVIIPYVFIMDGQEYFNHLDHRALSAKDFYGALKNGKTASTSLVTEQRYIDTFEPYLQQGKDILYMCLSSGLSSSYNQSVLATETLRQKYPDRKMAMIDSLTASLGQGMLAYYAVKARREGKSFEENAEYIKNLVPQIISWVRADDLNHLRRGGRVSGAAAFMGTMLNIKPMIHINDEGRLIPVAKMRGKGKSLEYLADRMAATLTGDSEHQLMYISHSEVPEEAQELAELITKRLGKREYIINDIGPVIGAHTGPGTICLFFVGTTREVV